jgi:hypothetical protein
MAATVTLKSAAQEPLVRSVIEATAGMAAEELLSPRVLRVLVERLADRFLPASDPLARARLRGELAMRELLTGDGGALPASEVANVLGISRQAVDKRRKAGQLLAVTLPRRGLQYPAWQFGERGGTPAGLVEVLGALRMHDPWSQARFFVSGNDRLGGDRPLDRLRAGQALEPVLQAARAYGEHADARTGSGRERGVDQQVSSSPDAAGGGPCPRAGLVVPKLLHVEERSDLDRQHPHRCRRGLHHRRRLRDGKQ